MDKQNDKFGMIIKEDLDTFAQYAGFRIKKTSTCIKKMPFQSDRIV